MRLAGAGEDWPLLQWANDWMTLQPPSGRRQQVIAPNRCVATGEEYERLVADRVQSAELVAEGKAPSSGFFWRWWEMDEHGVITRNRNAPPMMPYRKPKKDEDDE